jgi:pyruvate/2-oxoacid:ferredoxin oxidoreductase beta subunit
VQKASKLRGTKYIHLLSPCPTGWRYPSDKTIEVGRFAVNTNIFPLYEVENGRYTINRKPAKKIPIGEYLKLQGRFSHLDDESINIIQNNVDREWELLLRKEEFTKDMK